MNNLIFLCTQCAYAATTTFHPYLCVLYDYVVTMTKLKHKLYEQDYTLLLKHLL
ncbi:hypothetical protein SAMN04515674_102370 [Pseudarcicella hirudinis]|uniref:Uncharacterized protein n=1 Tax=Pseudarcicella hirudinis TaxID=1079859 RepID=A0A1I5PC14_9BACT|nr:hypothetical protein SAMN04515674_102370 [Pseudarcicella hirudinis]